MLSNVLFDLPLSEQWGTDKTCNNFKLLTMGQCQKSFLIAQGPIFEGKLIIW